jgi:RecB family exonuclease
VDAARWGELAQLVAPAERTRLAATLDDWVREGELAREAFVVVAAEQSIPLALDALQLSLRIDRIDRLPGGALAIIDYKTGRTGTPLRWFDPRPQAPQLALYLLAHRAAEPATAVSALAYAAVRAGEARWSGLAADALAWPKLGTVDALTRGRIADWAAAADYWRAALGAIAREFVAGQAAVRPRSGVCRNCGLQALCRVGDMAGDDDTGTADE